MRAAVPRLPPPPPATCPYGTVLILSTGTNLFVLFAPHGEQLYRMQLVHAQRREHSFPYYVKTRRHWPCVYLPIAD
jgi:hypothetical protein